MEETKTLTQQIAELPDDQIIHVGALSGFFFCGTKDEYEASIDTISDWLLLRMKQERDKLIRDKREFYRLWGQLAERMAAILADPDDQTLYPKTAKIAASLGVSIKEMPSINRRLPAIERNIKEFKPVRKRIVNDCYPRLDPEDGVNIIVEGCEAGRYWTLEEYRNGVVNSKDEEDYDDE